MAATSTVAFRQPVLWNSCMSNLDATSREFLSSNYFTVITSEMLPVKTGHVHEAFHKANRRWIGHTLAHVIDVGVIQRSQEKGIKGPMKWVKKLLERVVVAVGRKRAASMLGMHTTVTRLNNCKSTRLVLEDLQGPERLSQLLTEIFKRMAKFWDQSHFSVSELTTAIGMCYPTDDSTCTTVLRALNYAGMRKADRIQQDEKCGEMNMVDACADLPRVKITALRVGAAFLADTSASARG
jgi:hypothetical protein